MAKFGNTHGARRARQRDSTEAARDINRHRFFFIFVLFLLFAGLCCAIGGDAIAQHYLCDNERAALSHINHDCGNEWLVFVGKFLEHLGEIVGSTSALTLVADRFKEFSVFREFSEDISERVRTLIFSDLAGITSSGLSNILPKMVYDDIFDQLTGGDELFILTTFLEEPENRFRGLFRAARDGAQINILSMSPDSLLLDMRSEEILAHYYPSSRYKRELVGFVDYIKETIRKLEIEGVKTVALAEYKDLIGCPIYLIRRNGRPIVAYSSVYLGRTTGHPYPHFKWIDVGEDGTLHELDRYIRGKWNKWNPDQGASDKVTKNVHADSSDQQSLEAPNEPVRPPN